ncbi:hypothetical protein [Nonomuraea dietziae]|uniref:hypothetical protein n=1 Tax=Nonomuraea dietziae TaxID=65515 RepID=UPI0033F792A3
MALSGSDGTFDLQLRALPVHTSTQTSAGSAAFTQFSCRTCTTLLDTCVDTCKDTCCYDSRYC